VLSSRQKRTQAEQAKVLRAARAGSTGWRRCRGKLAIDHIAKFMAQAHRKESGSSVHY
jgi:hypothetical protein